MYEWDEAKRHGNIEKHGLDFWDAIPLFDGRQVASFPAKTQTEARILTVGKLDDGKFYTLVWTQREDVRRFISFRRSRHDEEKRYFALHG